MRRWRRSLVILVAIGAAVAALVIYNQRAEHDVASQMWIPKMAPITPEIVLLQQYVRIDTTNPPGNEIAGARFLSGILARNGVRAEIIESAPGRGNLYARIKGRSDSDALLLLNHMDVVPATSRGWSRAPFSAAVLFNQIYGRGTLDMKGIAICQLEGFLEVARSGRVPERDIIFLATADEEKDGVMGMAWLLEHRPDIFRGVRYALNEGGITETRQERISYFGVEIGTKMINRVRLHASSRQALQKTRIALEPFITPPDPERILPEVKEFFHDIAPLRTEQQVLLTDIDRTVALGKFWLLARGYKELTQNVLWLGGVERDGDAFALRVNMFNLPDELPAARIEWLRQKVAPFAATVEVLQISGPAPLSSRHTPLFELITREVRREYGSVPVGTEILAASYNDSRYLRARGVNAYGLWPFPVDFYQTQGIHGIDERVRADWFLQGIEVMRRLVRSYAFDPIPGPPAQ